MKTRIALGLSVLLLSLLAACRQDTEEQLNPPTYNGKVSILMDHFMGNDTLKLNKWYVTTPGDSMRPSMFRYYISNIKLMAGTGVWTVKNSYYLVDQEIPASKTLTLPGLPSASFDSIEFLIGVDSARNVSGAQSGALDPLNDMFWGWSQGYVFLKVEGIYRDSGDKAMALHVGGFAEPYNCIKKVTLPFGNKQLKTGGTDSKLVLHVNLDKMFTGAQTISLKTTNNLSQPGATAKKLADNYASMISFSRIE